MISVNLVILAALLYAAFLFAIAYLADRRTSALARRWLRSPLIYTLSLSIYCTAWTFYGAVGSAVRSGFEFLTIYLGPTLVMLAWWGLLRKLVRVGRRERITSIADMVSSRFGKSALLGGIVTMLVVLGTTPYIALQLQSVTLSLAVFAEAAGDRWGQGHLSGAAFYIAAGLAVFAILFGTRNVDANERHHGVVIAIAIEAVVKLVALVAVGVFVVWQLGGGVTETLRAIDASPLAQRDLLGGRWLGLTFASAAAFLCLPRMFHVLVVENADERHLATASWAFPAYLLLMSLFVVPIAVIGLNALPEGANPDLFVLSLPLSEGRGGLAMLSFLGGFSSATSMVIVATIALATMVSNHIIVPLWLRRSRAETPISGDIRRLLLVSRRLAIAGVLGLGYLYFRVSGGGAALASIGLISFCGVAQILPAMLGGLFWRGATRTGAVAGLLVGFAVWLWALFLPSVGGVGVVPPAVLAEGPLGIGWLRPQALFGLGEIDPMVQALFWSVSLNLLCFVIGSLVSYPSPVERLQAARFVGASDAALPGADLAESSGEVEALLRMSQRILGKRAAQRLFRAEAMRQNREGALPRISRDFLGRIERELAGSVGAATAHAMIGQLSDGPGVTVEDLMAVADEAAQIMEYSSRLEAKSAEQERTARALRDANDKLTALGVQKDAFLSQISHELRTPMASIRAFADILAADDLARDERRRFTGIIQSEAQRLTRLLDDLLDLSVVENRQVTLNMREEALSDVLDRAIAAAGPPAQHLTIDRVVGPDKTRLWTDTDRLSQVFINLIVNAAKYCDAPDPHLRISVRPHGAGWAVDFVDNGSGIAESNQALIFEKFARLERDDTTGGAGLGLAICREIMARLGGAITYLPGEGGAAFRVVLPRTALAESRQSDIARATGT